MVWTLKKEWDASLDSMVRVVGAPLVFTEYYQQVRLNNAVKSVELFSTPLVSYLKLVRRKYYVPKSNIWWISIL
jgi:hypothetical protein